MRSEGDGATRLVQLLRGDKRQETTILVAQVTNISPISIIVPGYRDEIPSEAIILAENLSDREMSAQLYPGESFINIKIKSPLSIGDSVICALVDDGQLFYVLDREAK